MRRFSLPFISLLFLLCSITVHGNNAILLSRITPEGGITYNSIMSIGEDDLGNIWFGSNDGLFCYNSKEIKRYSHFRDDPKTIPTNRINEIYKDNNGTLWIATENGICSYNETFGGFENYRIKAQAGNTIGKDITSFFQDFDNNYWFSDENGFGIVEPQKRNAIYLSIENKKSRVHKLYLDDSGTVWVFFSDGEIYFRKPASRHFIYFSKCNPSSIRSVLIDNKNVWIAYLQGGLHRATAFKSQVSFPYICGQAPPEDVFVFC